MIPMQRAYLDCQSATRMHPEVLAAMLPFLKDQFGNPSSQHAEGIRARDAIQQARNQIARFIGAASEEEIIFTSDGTESVNLAVKGAARALHRHGNHIIVSEIEHPAVLNSAAALEQEGFECTRIPVDKHGMMDPDAVRGGLRDSTTVISIHQVNHDVGTIQRVAEIGQIAAEHSAVVHVDAEAGAGWLPVDVGAMGAHLLSFSPHRFHGPKGVGVLYCRRRTRLTAQIHGGNQERGRRAGTENVAGIVGAGKAAELAAEELSTRSANVCRLQTRLWEGLLETIPHLRLNGPPLGSNRCGTNLNVSVEFIEGEGLMLLADLNGIAMASGTACVSKALSPSHVLEAIGASLESARSAVLLSVDAVTRDEEVDQALQTLPGLVQKLRGMSPAWEEFQARNSVIGSDSRDTNPK